MPTVRNLAAAVHRAANDALYRCARLRARAVRDRDFRLSLWMLPGLYP